jgi:hypothetical protein
MKKLSAFVLLGCVMMLTACIGGGVGKDSVYTGKGKEWTVKYEVHAGENKEENKMTLHYNGGDAEAVGNVNYSLIENGKPVTWQTVMLDDNGEVSTTSYTEKGEDSGGADSYTVEIEWNNKKESISLSKETK